MFVLLKAKNPAFKYMKELFFAQKAADWILLLLFEKFPTASALKEHFRISHLPSTKLKWSLAEPQDARVCFIFVILRVKPLVLTANLSPPVPLLRLPRLP